ncbi:MAG: DUF1963 domain-containing protein [Bacteroidales bacterium]|jgi:uncharacterized protein YwqG|nr:DUF1963 domain-containing protein [Bacteroidales bacterium]
MTEIEKIKKRIAKPATVFMTGGFRPTNSKSESWIGRVYLYKENEEIPKDSEGNLMMTVFQLCLDNFSSVPECLSDTKVLTVFMSKDFPVDLTPNGKIWQIREYTKTDSLIIKDLTNKDSFIKPFPLKPQIVEEDFPVWDGGGLPDEIVDEILELENSGKITDYYDITENHYGHKVGGYPSFCQPGIYFGEDFEFVFQIASDEKANLNIVDSGTIFLAKNTKTGEWVSYCDFY